MEAEWDGTLSPKQFEEAAAHLIASWPSWHWHKQKLNIYPDSVEGYLELEDFHVPSPEEEIADDAEYEYQEASDASSVDQHKSMYYTYTYHIVYKESYRVPALFFSARLRDGKLLEWNKVKDHLPNSSHKEIVERKWTFLTQEDHPYLHTPWFTLHPCGTSNLMKLMFEDTTSLSRRYLLSWLSFAGEAAGLRISSHKFL